MTTDNIKTERQPELPQTPAEWQEAVDLAAGFLQIESARSYGLIQGGPVVDEAACERIISEARARGFQPRPDAGEWVVSVWMTANPGRQIERKPHDIGQL